MAKRKPKPADLARLAALRGDPDAAIPVLRECGAAGDDAAAASLAELLAFSSDWAGCLAPAGRLVANPYAVHAANVFNGMVGLLGRAGRETGSWADIAAIATAARAGLRTTLDANVLGFPEEKVRAESARLFPILARLGEYAVGGGAPPHELVHIFGAASGPPDESAYRAAVALNAGKPPARLLALAIAFDVPAEAVRLYPAVAAPSFEESVYVAKVHARAGERDRAWGVLATAIPRWWPVDPAQVAPVELLTDEDLSGVVTADRARRVLRTARGPAAK